MSFSFSSSFCSQICYCYSVLLSPLSIFLSASSPFALYLLPPPYTLSFFLFFMTSSHCTSLPFVSSFLLSFLRHTHTPTRSHPAMLRRRDGVHLTHRGTLQGEDLHLWILRQVFHSGLRRHNDCPQDLRSQRCARLRNYKGKDFVISVKGVGAI